MAKRGLRELAVALRPEPALSLALLRVVVAGLMLIAPGFREGARVAARDPASFVVPEGLGWFVRVLPINAALAHAIEIVVAFAALCAMAGIRARLACGVLAVGGFYLYAIAQLTGHVWHDMHLLWFVALLAVSPCADVLAVDRRRPLGAEGRRYAVPLLAVRLLLGAVYLFPAIHKLATSGLGWALSDNLRWQLYWKWAEHGAVPGFRIDRTPALLHAGGLFVLAFELSFVGLTLYRRTRAIAALAGVAFHLAAQAIFKIPFASLWLCYIALVDVRPVVTRLLGREALERPPDVAAAFERGSSPRASALACAVLGALLLGGAIVQGVRGQTRSYPFACYPTFDRTPPPEMPDLMIVAIDGAGVRTEIGQARDASGHRTQRQWGEIWALAGVTAPVDPARLRAHLRTLRLPGATERVVFYRVYRSVIPEDGLQITRPPLELVALNPRSESLARRAAF
jgi:hypothetical protein